MSLDSLNTQAMDLGQYVNGGANVVNFDSNFYISLLNMIVEAASEGITVRINDGWRDNAVQAQAYNNWRATGNNLAGNQVPSIAPPGRSRHEVGLAADISASGGAGLNWVHQNASRFGLAFTVSGEPWHATFVGAQTKKTVSGADVPGWDTYTGSSPANGSNFTPDTEAFSTGGPNSSTGDPAAPAAFSGVVPSDMVLIDTPDGQVVGFEIASGTWAYFDGDQVGQVQGIPNWAASATAWEDLNTIRIGDVTELDDLAGNYDSFGLFFEEMSYLAGIPKSAMNDAGIAAVLATFASRPDMTPQELARRLQETEYYQERNATEREWNDLGRADKEKRISDAAVDIQDALMRYGGVTADFADAQVQQWAEQVASGQKTLGVLINSEIKPLAAQAENSPWARTIRDEEREKLQAGVDYENEASRARSLANRWGVQLSDDEALNWGRKITENIMSEDDYTEYLKDVADSLYAWKGREQETMTAAQPYLQAYATTFEVAAPDLFNGSIQQAMQTGMSTYDYGKQLRSSDRAQTTQQMRDGLQNIGGEVSQLMGFS